MRQTFGCCARAMSGHAPAAPPSSVMNWRRLMCSPQAEDDTLPQAVLCITAFWPARLPLRVIHVALVASVNRPHVRFASESDRIAAQQRNDAQCQERPRAGAAIDVLFDHLVGAGDEERRHVEAERLGGLRLMTRSNFVGCSTGMSAGFAPRRILTTRSAPRRNRAGKFGP